jgi:hypothetical protein
MEAICTSRPHCTPITNSTNGQDSLSTGVGRVRILLKAHGHTARLEIGTDLTLCRSAAYTRLAPSDAGHGD